MARKILLADDSVTAQNMGRKILADAGYDVVTVNNGSAALKRIAEIKPDLIVLDVYMPGYSGLEVCQRLKDAGETAHIPVLLTVGKLEPFKAEEARRVRADAHIVKPFEASELLTAITRLEDRMVPQQSEGARFSTSVADVERFDPGNGRKTEGSAEADTGWKSRLRFPSKKKKEEPEPEDGATGATFRDFRKGKSKTAANSAFTVNAAPPPGQEPGLVPDIPRDITPAELDALSALAAKLDGPIPASEDIAPLAEKVGSVEAPEFARTKTEAAVPAVAAETQIEKTEVEKTEAEMPIVEPAAAAADAPASAVEGKSAVEITAEHTELAAEGTAAAAGPAALETEQHEIQTRAAQLSETQLPETPHVETPAVLSPVTVDTALLAQEPAPVDRNDEPLFASAASAVAPVAQEQEEDKAAEKIDATPAEAVAKSEMAETSEATEAGAPSEAIATKGPEPRIEESKVQELNAEELHADKIEPPVPVAASMQEAAESEEPPPSDAELAEALRLLTPSTGQADVSTVPSHGALVAAGQLLAEEAARAAAAAPRWVAEPVALSPEEAAISLEAEMFRTFAARPATTPGGETDPVRVTGVSAIAAAVENRLAMAGLAASAQNWAEQALEHDSVERGPVEHSSETTVAEPSAAEVEAAVSSVSSPAADGIEPEKIEAEQKDSPANVVEEMPAEDVAAATFADAVAPAIVAEENQDSSSDVGGQEAMGKSAKSKSGKSNWHQIRTAPASAAAKNDVVEEAKQAERGAEEAPKAMAAAAAAEGSVSVADARTIASIVDSVMADLRPKIVEEIAKKLAGK